MKVFQRGFMNCFMMFCTFWHSYSRVHDIQKCHIHVTNILRIFIWIHATIHKPHIFILMNLVRYAIKYLETLLNIHDQCFLQADKLKSAQKGGFFEFFFTDGNHFFTLPFLQMFIGILQFSRTQINLLFPRQKLKNFSFCSLVIFTFFPR